MRAYRNTAVAAAIEAGQAILEIYHSGNFDVTSKGTTRRSPRLTWPPTT